MRRRAYVGAVAAVLGLSGCVSSPGSSPETSPPETSETRETRETRATTDKPTESPVRRTAEGVDATFRVVDGHAPTDDTADATFEGGEVVVTGSMDPAGCRRPALSSVAYDRESGTVRLVVGSERRYETVTVECGNASYDYRCVVRVEDGTPTRAEVVHDRHDGEDSTFVTERG